MDAPNFYCLCGYVHVLTGAKWISLVGTAGYTLGLFCAMVAQSVPMMLLCIFTVPFYVSLLYACQKQEPSMYIPFMVLNGVEMVLTSFYALFLLAMLIWVPEFWHRHLVTSLSEEGDDATAAEEGQMYDAVVGAVEERFITALLLAIVSALVSLLAWCQLTVNRAYKYTRVDQHTLIPPQLHPTFVLTKAKLGLTDVPQMEDVQQERKRESRLA